MTNRSLLLLRMASIQFAQLRSWSLEVSFANMESHQHRRHECPFLETIDDSIIVRDTTPSRLTSRRNYMTTLEEMIGPKTKIEWRDEVSALTGRSFEERTKAAELRPVLEKIMSNGKKKPASTHHSPDVLELTD